MLSQSGFHSALSTQHSALGMPSRIAAVMALIAFALCLLMGMGAENTLSTTLVRALEAMGVTFVVGLAIGTMAQKMLDENLSAGEKKSEIEESKPAPRDR
ncbi:MAG: hypothetical protein JWN24_2334 [Phycisphaerales bacterium]|nr:hypothetical protein [Phycisphaerales bacterium]